MQRFARWFALGGATFALAVGGCGGGGAGVVTECGLDVHVPNYAREVSRLFVWPAFPVSVHFIRDAQLTPARRSAAITGFDRWTAAIGPRVSYVEIDEPSGADITVRFVDDTPDGRARLTFSGLTMLRARIDLGTEGLDYHSISCVSAHEFGHALGIYGHSATRGDLMYPVYTIGHPCGVTERDANTLRTGYCDLFTRGTVRARAAPPGAPVQTVTID
ncbi:MAG TPA: matrixin family metalloprotease [Chthonomonadales bacterium]|nr:matrixin family metalloprotease [Chthonomonadales bacterium]